MSGKKEDRATHYHNEGQEDAAKGYGNHEPPKGLIHSIIDSDAAEDNKNYTEGYRHGAEQRDKK